MSEVKRVSLDLDKETKERVKNKAFDEGRNISGYLRNLIRKDLVNSDY